MRIAYLYTMRDMMRKGHSIELSDDGMVDGLYPIEDYGDYFISNDPIVDALERWMNHLTPDPRENGNG